MSNNSFLLSYKLRFILASLLIVGGLFLLSFVLSFTSTDYKVHAATSNPSAEYSSSNDDPNIITNLMSSTGTKLTQGLGSTQKTLNNSMQTFASSAVSVPSHSFKWIGNNTYKQVSFIANTSSGAFKFVTHVPGKMVSSVSSFSLVKSTIRPADDISVPAINVPKSSVTSTGNPAPLVVAPNAPAAANSDSAAQWPIHGAITTAFGVPEWPYQPIHTGIDISDGKRAGTTPIKPFKPGKVVQVIRSKTGLGNHVIVDHGGGMTSVYGHLYSISVQVGQVVDKNTILGYEGSTGASTGTHLHFEVRINGQPMNPRKFVAGHP